MSLSTCRAPKFLLTFSTLTRGVASPLSVMLHNVSGQGHRSLNQAVPIASRPGHVAPPGAGVRAKRRGCGRASCAVERLPLCVEMTVTEERARTYEVRTYGCQMNVHDSERLSGLLEDAGYVRGRRGRRPADVVVFNTCAVRENADNRLYGNLGHLAPVKASNPGMQIAVGGCLAQKDRATIIRQGALGRRRLRHPQHRLAAGAARARARRSRRRRSRSSSRSRSSRRRCRPSASRRTRRGCRSRVGCNNTCTFCIVPALRGKEKDRRPGDILAEIRALVDEGVCEVTLLGQNVNSYGVEFGDRQAFAQAAARLRRDRRASSGCGSPRPHPARRSPTT